jgi:hypothetical protein
VSKLNWQEIDIRIIAVVASIVISCFTYLFPEPLNDDAFLYLRTAEIYLRDGLGAAYTHYSWASYSVLIALFSLLGFTLIQAAFFINGLFFALLTYAFISVVKTVDDSNGTLIAAAVVVLVFPELNEYRYFIIRDIGFWALVFSAIWQLSLFIQHGGFIHAAAFCGAFMVAASLRIEAIAYLVFVPLMLLAVIRVPNQFRRVVALNFGSVLALVSATVLLLVVGVNPIALAAQFISTYSPFFIDAFSPDPERTFELSNTLFGSHGAIYSGYYLTIFMAAGFFALLIISIANAVGLPLLTVLFVGLIKQLKMLNLQRTKVLLAVILVNFIIAFGFIYVTRFLPSRYSMILAISIAALIPILVNQWFIEISSPPSRWQRLAPFLVVIYLFVDSYISFGRPTNYIDNAVTWLDSEQLQVGQLITNESAIAYFSQVVEDYDRVSNDVFVNKITNAKIGDFVAIETRQPLGLLIEEHLQSDQFELLAAFPEEAKARILIYRRSK